MTATTPTVGRDEAGPRVAVLLATYNGADFLAAQLDSLLAQTYRDFVVVVRDDGSTDNTREILAGYQARYPSQFHCVEKDETNRGASGSFSFLCEYALGNKAALGIDRLVACFCDQDDVWARNKIEVEVAALIRAEEGDTERPVLVHSDLVVVDASLQQIAPSFIAYQGLEIGRATFPALAISNVVTGCTALFNEALLRESLPVPKRAIMHDWWLAMTATAVGKLVFVPDTLVQYRQHGRNTIGAKPHGQASAASGKRASLLNRVLSLETNEHLIEVSVQAAEFSRVFASRLPLRYRLALALCRRMRTQGAIRQRLFYRLARKL